MQLCERLGETRHRNILRFYGAWEDRGFVYVATQLCKGGELPDWLRHRADGYSERIAARVTYDILQALAFLEEKGVVHRDVKPQNLLFTEPAESAYLKLIDFGLAAELAPDAPPLTETCGTIDFMSPECIRGVAYRYDADVWGAGVLLAMMLSGTHPFRQPTEAETGQSVLRYGGDVQSILGDGVGSEPARSLLEWLLSPQGTDRPSAKQALKHEWIRFRNDPDAPGLAEDVPERFFAQCYKLEGESKLSGMH